MRCIGRNDADETRTQALSRTVNRQLKLSVNDVIDLFLRVEVLMDRGAGVEFVMREGHAGRIEVAAPPSRQPLDDRQFAGVDESHFYAPLAMPAAHYPHILRIRIGARHCQARS